MLRAAVDRVARCDDEETDAVTGTFSSVCEGVKY